MTQSVGDIARMLADRAEDVCRHLLPGGKKSGSEFECDSTAGGKGRSLKVCLSGPKVGIWADFATGSDSGDMVDLWAAARNIKLADAIREAKDWLGIREPKFEPVRKTYTKPKMVPAPIGDRALRYLQFERKILSSTIGTFSVGTNNDGTYMAFPSYNPEGELMNVKYIGVDRDEEGKKRVRTEGGCAPALFGWQAFKGGRTIAITEGEIDALTMHQFGVPALSVPFGAGKGNKNDWIDFEWDNLAQFETIYLCYDNDDAGQGCVEEVARRLGIHRCKSVKLLFKDANECLQKGVSDEEVQQCLKEAKTFDPPEIRSPTEFRDKVQSYFYPSEEREALILSPKIFNKKIGFRPGELTVWTGCNSHGKSVMIGQIMLIAAIIGQNVAIASMEMKPEQTLGRMLKQFWAKRQPTPDEINQALDWMAGKIWIYDMMGNVPTKKLMELIEFSVCRHRVAHFVIDSLMKCDVGGEDYDGQRRFLNEAVTFAKKNDCHIHLVAHPRKHEEERPVGRVAVSGSGDISNQADNVLSVWRNKAKERNEKTWTERDAILLCDKQRETGWEGYVELEFWKPTEQYVKVGSTDPTHFHEWVFKKPEPAAPPQELPGEWEPPPEEPPAASFE